MDCNCDCNNKNKLNIAEVRLPQGNMLRLAIPLTKRVITLVNGQVESTDYDFVPNADYPVEIILMRGKVEHKYEAEMRDGNVACMEDAGTLTTGTYALEVRCHDDQGAPCRFKQRAVVNITEYTADAGILPPVEFEAQEWYLNPAIFLLMKGDKGDAGRGIADIEIIQSHDSLGANIVTIVLDDGTRKPFVVYNGVLDANDVVLDTLTAHGLIALDRITLNGVQMEVVTIDNTEYLQFSKGGKTILLDISRADKVVMNNDLVNNYYNIQQIDAMKLIKVHVTRSGNQLTADTPFYRIAYEVENGNGAVAILDNVVYSLFFISNDYIMFSNVLLEENTQTLLIVDNEDAWELEEHTIDSISMNDVEEAIAQLVDSAPATLDTLKELAAALGDDPNFATTMATELGKKVDKVTGKGLSTNDYTTAEKNKLANLATVASSGSYNDLTDKPVIPEGTDLTDYYKKTEVDGLLDDKVDKVGGKGLSSNDYTDAEKTKLAGIAAGAEANVQADWEQSNSSADDYIKNKPTIPAPYDDTALAGRVTALENAGYITTETDPTVPSWAKQSSKPSYTASEVGAVPTTRKVNNKALSSDITLSASDVGALPSDTSIPSKTSDLTNDSGFLTKQMYYGTCATAAATMPKVCTVETFETTTTGGVTHAKDGTIIAVKFTNSDTNTSAAPTLNVNNIGAKAIMYNNTIVTSTAKNTTVAGTAKMLAYYRYDSSLDDGNGAWEYLGKSVDSNSTYTPLSLGFGYATQNNASASATVTAALSSYTLTSNGIVSVKFTYDVPANATLNINSKGAKAIYNRGAAITAGVIKAGDTATFIYSTYYHLISVDSWQEKQDAISDLATIRSGASAGATAIQSSDLATVATTGAYSDLSGKPSLATVATSGSYNDLSNKPTLFSGNYNDLTNKPTIPSAQVNADWNASSGVMEILNKPTIPTKFSDLVDDSDYITAQDVASIVVGSADVVITETASHINITFVTTSISFTPNTTMSLWAGQKVGTLTVSGTHLKQDITLTVPTNFTAQVSGGTAAQSITIPQTGGEVTGVSVTITYTGADSGSYNGSITATSGSTTASVGLVYSQYQGATIIAGTIGTINAAMGSPRIGELNVSGVNLEGDITASVGSGDFTICATQNGTYGTTATISKASAEASGGATLYVKYTPSSGTSTASGTLTLTTPKDGSTTTESVSLQGAVSTLTLSTNSVSISTDQNVAATGTFTINGSNLTNGVTLALTDANSVFSLSKNSLTKAEAEAGETITVTYNSSAAGNHSGSIAVNWDGTTQTVSLSGTAAVAATSDAEGKFTKEVNGKTLYLKRKIVDGQKTTDVEVHQSNYDTAWNGTIADTYGGNIVIPATVVVDGVTCNVVKIASNAFRYSKGKTKLQSLSLPEGITTIGSYFLYQAQAVTSIIIPSTVTTINDGFCTQATNLLTIDMRCQKNPNFQTTWGAVNNAHCRYCTKLTSFVVPDKVERFIEGSYKPFENCPALTEITLGTDLVEFRSLFSSATGVTKIYCRSTTPPLINELSSTIGSIPSTVYENAQVYVPTGYKQAYLDVVDGKPANGKVWYPFEQYHALIEYNPD